MVDDPHALVRKARLQVVATTPTDKGIYTGLLKISGPVRAPQAARAVAVPVAIAAVPSHRESVATALVALLAELGATVPAPPFAVLEFELADPK